MDLPYASVKEAVRETPAFSVQAAGVAIGLSLGVGILMFLGAWFFAMAFDITSPWRPGAALGGLSMILCILYWAFGGGVERISWQRETVIGQDINRSPYGRPQQTKFLVIEQQDGNTMDRTELPLPEDDMVLREWIEAAISRHSLAADKWEAEFGYVYPNGIKTPVYTAFKDEIIKRKWVIDRGSHGIIISNEGRKVFAKQLEQLALPESVE
jgi:hypothetical protein